MTTLKLYNQYRQTLANLYRSRKKYQRKQDKRTVTLINGMIQDVIYALQGLERHLPLEKRKFTMHKIKLYKKRIADYKSNDGVIPEGTVPVNTPHDILYDVDFRQALNSTIESVCNEEQKYLLSAYFMYGITQEQLAKKKGVNKSRICQQLREIILKIRNSHLFSAYLMQKN